MPIRPENRARYPKDWKVVSLSIRAERAGWLCEGSPAYPDCRVLNGLPHPSTGSLVVLTVGHLDHTPENCDESNLRAACQRCHLLYDHAHHMETAALTHDARVGQLRLFDVRPAHA